MAIAPRHRINLMSPPGDAVVFFKTPIQIRQTLVRRCAAFWRRVWLEDSTLLAEIACWGFVLSWSCSLLMYRTQPLPAPYGDTFESLPYFRMAIFGAVLSVAQFVSMLSLNERARSVCSFHSAVWLGGLAFSLLAADRRVPSGLGYLLLCSISLLSFWRVRPRSFITLLSGAFRSDRS